MEVATAVAVECYLQHADAEDNPDIDLEQGKLVTYLGISMS